MSNVTSHLPGAWNPSSIAPGNSTSAHDQQCNASASDWATLILSVIPVVVSWWLFELPKIFKQGVRAFFEEVVWQCLRLVFPSVAGIFAVLEGKDPSEWSRLYYAGPSDRMTMLKWMKFAVTDTITVVSTVMSLVKFCNLPPEHITKGWNVNAYAFPTLPATIVGLWILVASRLRLRHWFAIPVGFIVTLGIGAAITGAMQLAINSAIVWFAYLGYSYVAAPAVLLVLWALPLAIGAASLSIFTRMYGVAGSAILDDAYFPFCPLLDYRYIFASVYLGLGTVAAFLALFAVYRKVNATLQRRKVDQQRRHIATWHGVVPEKQEEGEGTGATQPKPVYKKPKVVGKTTVTWR